MLSKKDLSQIKERGMSKEQVEEQVERFKKGFPNINIVKPATSKEGIKVLSEKREHENIRIYNKMPRRTKKVKFVPASGAASRMFKKLYQIMENYEGTEDDYLEIMADRGFNSLYYMCQNLKNFAFYNDLAEKLEENGASFEEVSKKKDVSFLLKNLLTEEGLNYGNLPKGLLKFHRNNDGERTPVEEHMVEGASYAASGRKVRIHFTVSPQHIELFEKHVEEVKKPYEKKHKVKFDIDYSVQKPETDTIAVDMDNKPFRTEDGELLFRPGGHGALIENLNDLNADIVFIKNIDNVVQDRLKEENYYYKEVLAGTLLYHRNKVYEFINKLNKKPDAEYVEKAENFLRKKLCVIPPEGFENLSLNKKIAYIKKKMNRPMRVCGMVRNEGEPGGGPFWVRNEDDSMTLQIVESSQIADDKKDIMAKSTHFNPVDIVCSIKDYKGRKFNLLEYVDKEAGFISKKSVDGKDIKALELPGLWNGAMAHWTTLFIEVPGTTFNPVKTVNDLLRTEHLYEKDLLAKDDGDKSVFD